jgi:hypothetical protein
MDGAGIMRPTYSSLSTEGNKYTVKPRYNELNQTWQIIRYKEGFVIVKFPFIV